MTTPQPTDGAPIIRWFAPLDPPLPPLTEEARHHVEEVLGLRLPQAYLDLLEEQNGGAIDEVACPLDDVPGTIRGYVEDGAVTLTGLFGVAVEDRYGSILESPSLCREWGLPEGLVLIDGDGHTWVALDGRGDGEPRVVFVVSEPLTVVRLAETFREFLGRLRPMVWRDDKKCPPPVDKASPAP
mgnify:CR=1 FL=1